MYAHFSSSNGGHESEKTSILGNKDGARLLMRALLQRAQPFLTNRSGVSPDLDCQKRTKLIYRSLTQSQARDDCVLQLQAYLEWLSKGSAFRRWYTKAVFGLEPCLQATKASRILDQSITDETGLNFELPEFDFPIHYPSEPVGG